MDLTNFHQSEENLPQTIAKFKCVSIYLAHYILKTIKSTICLSKLKHINDRVLDTPSFGFAPHRRIGVVVGKSRTLNIYP